MNFPDLLNRESNVHEYSSDDSDSVLSFAIIAASVVCSALVVAKAAYELFRWCLRPCLDPTRKCILCERDFSAKRKDGGEWDLHRQYCAKVNGARLLTYAGHPSGAACPRCRARPLRLVPAYTEEKFVCGRRRCAKARGRQENDGANCYACYECDVVRCGDCLADRAAEKLTRYGVADVPGAKKAGNGILNAFFSPTSTSSSGGSSYASYGGNKASILATLDLSTNEVLSGTYSHLKRNLANSIGGNLNTGAFFLSPNATSANANAMAPERRRSSSRLSRSLSNISNILLNSSAEPGYVGLEESLDSGSSHGQVATLARGVGNSVAVSLATRGGTPKRNFLSPDAAAVPANC